MFEEVVRYPKIPQGISMASFKDKAFSNKSTALYYQDRTLQLENGCKMRVKGTKHAYKSIEAGKAVLTQCASCGTVSQVDASCKALYCTHCEQITPVREMTPSDIDIARAVQSQEKEVSYLGK